MWRWKRILLNTRLLDPVAFKWFALNATIFLIISVISIYKIYRIKNEWVWYRKQIQAGQSNALPLAALKITVISTDPYFSWEHCVPN